ncbi:IclR family transcriptional regulator [Bradyrhizobium canariense]|uniref:Transcriptional regulator, IclR family n=1 Tax=Bradyrhizobium canariense TaxID=255045 RepID=A0A1H1SQQ2_9BRAD|nr:IclR family transcriptional regulator [Bradyrhizobium canariense]SDS49729.1 transcriptional regulator, IclR family [Bradyrhizobium canariense]
MATAPNKHGEHADDRLFIMSIGKCFHLLECFNTAQRALTLSELAQIANFTTSTVQRLTHTLCLLGYLRQHPRTRAYVLSSKLLEFGHSVLAANEVREIAEPHLRRLNQESKETVNLMELEGEEIVYVSRFASVHPVSVNLHVGSRLPAFCSAAGRAILAYLAPEQAQAILARRRVAMTKYTVTDLKALNAILDRARRDMFVINDQEAYLGDISVAAPIFDRDGDVRSAINIAVPSSRWTVAGVKKELAPMLLECARRISRDIDGRS